ncbi:uncharacterized protein LOC122500894 isoform X2 [Leptopilina heterotoma]|uniref:uncharacterized protein LOC122500894 isoform X2 n=1 Tax=Leptopilina heterotoma TaxID=63436 RepID=UPI001CAA3BC4|nr:uncharacterized protein LOC122500894 isoform X2 [Leptopilina heterotoma]
MLTKSVYCKIGTGDQSRCKKIKFDKDESASDCQSIKEALLKCAEKDKALNIMFENKYLVLQQENQKIKQNCDLDSQESVENESVLNVLLISIQHSDAKPVEISTLCDYKILATFDDPVIKENTFDKTPLKELIKVEQVLDNPIPSSSKSKGPIFQTPRVNYPAELPSLPTHLKKIKADDKVYESQAPFIFLWSTHLESLTDCMPTKIELFNYCKTIVDSFPELKGGEKNDFDVLKNQISTAIRNRRYQRKIKLNKSKKTQNNSVSASTPTKKIKLSSETDSNEAMAALKKCSASDESNHAQRLLRETYFQRREWIENESKNVRDIIIEYPWLESYASIILDFSLLRDKTEISLRDSVDKMIGNVAIFFDIKIESEVHKIQAVQKLHENLMVAKVSKLNEPFITIEEEGIRQVY